MCKLWCFVEKNIFQILTIKGEPYEKKSQFFFSQEISYFTYEIPCGTWGIFLKSSIIRKIPRFFRFKFEEFFGSGITLTDYLTKLIPWAHKNLLKIFRRYMMINFGSLVRIGIKDNSLKLCDYVIFKYLEMHFKLATEISLNL